MSSAFALPQIDPAVDAVVRISLALLLFLSAFRKIGDFPTFRAAVEAYRILPPAVVGWFAAAVVVMEKVAAVGMLASPVRGPFALSACALFLVYAVAIATNLARGRADIDCGCGGGSQPLRPALVVRNLLLAAAAFAAALPANGREMGAVDAFTVAAGVVVASFLYKAADGLIGLATPASARFEPGEAA